MFGSIAKLKLKPGSLDKMLAMVQSLPPVKGRVFNAVFRSQTDPDEVWSVVGFEDEASYRSNSDDPETEARSKVMREMMAAPPEWHDGEIVWDKRW
jgi:hypothetical protein